MMIKRVLNGCFTKQIMWKCEGEGAKQERRREAELKSAICSVGVEVKGVHGPLAALHH